VSERQMSQAFEEAGGRATPPNRLDEILKKADEESSAHGSSAYGHSAYGHNAERQPAGRPVGKLWAAALLFVGLAATITAGVLENQGVAEQSTVTQENGENGSGGSTVGMQTGDQDPKPKPKSKPKPKPKQEPKQKPKAGPAENKSGKQLPKGTDPADLALLRSAEKMLEAEKKLREMVKSGRIAGVDQVLPFDQLSGWKYTDGLKGMPKKVKALDGKKVLMLGFMLPIDEVQDIKEFLLVESLWSCCYGTPPDINGILRCVMPKDKHLDYQFDPLKIVGTIKVEQTLMDGYCVDIYQLHVDYIEVLDGVKKEPAKKPVKKGPVKKGPVKKGPVKKEPGK
jgi:hypothetical protein